MIRFLARRLALALGILLALSIMVYGMLNIALDPLDDLRTSTSPARPQLIASRIQQLGLDKPWYVRYWDWLTAFVRGDLGEAWRSHQPVKSMLGPAILTSMQLVFFATVIAILLGVTVGLVSALRQYTTFDYSITFVSFVLYSLPVFWVAVLLKQYLAIGLNNYLNNPTINWLVLAVVALIGGLFWAGALGGDRKRKLIIFASATAVTAALLAFLLGSGWLLKPSIGIIGLAIIGLGTAVATTAIFAGIRNKRALYAALTTAAVGLALYYPLQYLFYYVPMNYLSMIGLGLVAIGVGVLVGVLWGGPDKGVSARVSAVTAFVMSFFVYVDQVMQYWQVYSASSVIKHRPIATIGSITPGLGGNFWVQELDKFTHLLLPSIALVLISFAGYTRYQRGSMLEVLNQDYIRTARAKGLSERVVIVRHAMRNALLPLASIIPVDFVSLIGGAVITESIFGWAGMGKLFRDSLFRSEVDPLMAYVMITGAMVMLANLAADFLYAVLDPRIRVNA